MKSFFTRISLLLIMLISVAGRLTAQSGSALSFVNTSNQYVSVPHSSSINLGANFTMEAIVNYTGNNSTIVDKGNYDFLWQLNANSNNNRMGFFIANTNTWVYSVGSVPQGVSTHVAIVCNGGSITFYINGSAAGNGSGSARQDNQAMTIGRQQPSSGGCQCNHMNGTIEDLRIWNVARSQTQITDGINLGVPNNSTGLVANYKFDEGSGNTTADASGNGNNGTLVNGPSWVASYARPVSYTYTVPAGVHSIRVKLWGGGAAGGTCDGPSGGGGVFVQSNSLPVVAGQVYTVVPGSGGYLVNQSGGESYILLNGNKIVGALGGTPKFGQGNVSVAANAEYSYKGGDAGTNVSYSDGSGTHILYGGGGASGGTTGAGGNGANASNNNGIGAGGQPVGNGGAGGSGGHQINCEQIVSPFAVTGANPGGGGGAPFYDYLHGGGGHGKITITECYSPGTITGHTRPFPYELITDSVFNENIGSPQAAPYTWEQSTNNSTWTTAPGGITSRSYPIQVANPPDVIYYRRKEGSCGLVSNTAIVKTFSIPNGQLKGKMEGTVVSINNTGVDGIPVEAQKTVAVLGSPITKIYRDTTKNGGKFSFKNVFFGDASNGEPSTPATQFRIKTVYAGHTFSPPLLPSLANTGSDFEVTGLKITDSTVYSINGTVSQTCNTCDAVVSDGIDSVKVSAVRASQPVGFTYTGNEGHGNFGLTFTEPGDYVLTPTYRNHSFTPNARIANVINGNVTGMTFTDNTTRTISGTLRAGGNQVIGSAQLVFTDTIPGQPFKFTTTVNTATDGSYTVTLPARKYKVRVLNFNAQGSGTDIQPDSLIKFFNQYNKDSMLVDIDTLPRTFNLIYHRAPVLQIVNLPDTTCGTADYVVFRQNKAKTFIINVFEGNPSYGFKVATDTVKRIRLTTDVHVNDVQQTILRGQVNGADTLALPGGSPNIIAPYQKIFRLDYTDKYGRSATQIVRKVVVLGVKNDPGTFTTISPQIPLMILHDPPGDQSSSFWETNETNETAMRLYTAKTEVDGGFIEAKLGTRFMLGFGYTSEVSIWGTLNFSQQVTGRVNDAREAILTTTNGSRYESSNSSYIIGSDGDVYIGAALNLLYAVGREVNYVSPCELGRQDKLAIADSGFATEYAYTESHITGNIIPTLQNFVANSPDSAQRFRAMNQISVWEQVIANNAANKAKATHVLNKSFNGADAPFTRYTTSSSTSSNTIEFSLEVDKGVAIGLGLEIAGIGVSGGYNVHMKMETGKSLTQTSTSTSTMGYTLDDKDDGDFFSVDVRRDPVYNSPVFTLVAGTTSCPAEPPGQNRDGALLRIPTPVQSNIPANGVASFPLYLGNVSQSGEERDYKITMLPGSNPFGAIVKVGFAPATDVFDFPGIPFGQEQLMTVTVEKGAGDVYNYEGLRFVMSSACGGSTSVGTITANFASACSGIALNAPATNFILASNGNNTIPVQATGYTIANLQSITLEHTTAGGSLWITDTTILQANITNPTSTMLTWRTSAIADGAYDLRLKLVCAGGTVYSQRVTGIVDRQAPQIFGRPEPMDNSYVAGDIISVTYNEFINTNNLNSGQVQLRKRSDGTLIPILVTGYQNKIVVVPANPITSFVGENIQLIVTNIADVYGNVQPLADTSLFVVGTTVPGTGPSALNLTVTRSSVKENANDSLDFRFNIGTSVNYDRFVNYTISGTATYGTDYTVRYPAGQPPTTSFNGIQGKIYILQGQVQAILRIKAIGDNILEPDETITISLAEGDYVLGSVISKTDTIKNDDLNKPMVYKNGPTNLCAGQSLTLSTDNTIDGLPVFSYQWTNGTTSYGTQSLNVTQPGTYRLTVYTANGFTGVSDSILVTISGQPAPSLGADITVYKSCFGETTNLNTLFTTTGLSATWNTANTLAALPGIYRLVAANTANCTDTAFAYVILEVATWTGAVSNDWNVAGNWNIGKVPGELTHVIVPGGTPNPCYIYTTDAVAASIQVRNGGVVRAISNQALKVNGKCLTLPPN